MAPCPILYFKKKLETTQMSFKRMNKYILLISTQGNAIQQQKYITATCKNMDKYKHNDEQKQQVAEE
jgi:hypothetical protein